MHPANLQDRDGLGLVCARIRRRFPWLQHLFADAGYQGDDRLVRRRARAAAARDRQAPPRRRRASTCCPAAGSSSLPSPGSAGTAAWPRTSSGSSTRPPPWLGRALAIEPDNYVIRYNAACTCRPAPVSARTSQTACRRLSGTIGDGSHNQLMSAGPPYGDGYDHS